MTEDKEIKYVEKPNHVPTQFEIESVDVTAEQLRDFTKHPILKEIVETLSEGWTMGKEDRDKNTRIGSVDIYTDDDGHLHLDFVTRFSCEKDSTKS